MPRSVDRGRSIPARVRHRLWTIADIARAQVAAGWHRELELWAFRLVERALDAPDEAVLDRAIEIIRRILVHGSGPAGTDRLAYLLPLAIALQRRFERRRSRAALDESIAWRREAADLAAAYRSGLAWALELRFEQYGDIDDLEQAVAIIRQVQAALESGAPEDDDEDLADALNDLARLLLLRFGRTADPADLAESIDLARSALSRAGTDPLRKSVFLSLLGSAWLTRFEQNGTDRDLDRCVEAYREVLLMQPDGPRDVEDLSNLGIALQWRFEHTGTLDGALDDLHESIRLGREALAGLPDEHPERGDYLTNLGGAMLLRFEHSGSPGDLDEAIACQRAAFAAAADWNEQRARYVSNLSNSLRIRYLVGADPADLAEADAIGRQMLAGAPVQLANLGVDLSQVGATLATRFEHSGLPGDLDGAIAQLRRSLSVISPRHVNRPRLLSNLSHVLRLRYTFAGNLADLDQAIVLSQHAVETCPPGHIDRGLHLTNLGTAVLLHAERTETLRSLDEATEVLRAAVAATAERYLAHPMTLANLAQVLLIRYAAGNGPSALDESIAVGRQALSRYPAAHVQRAMCVSNLAAGLLTRFQHGTKAPADLGEGIDLGRQALAAVHPDHPERARLLQNHAVALRERFELLGDPADLTEAWQAWSEASESATSPVGIRIRAATTWGRSAAMLAATAQALAGYGVAVALLPTWAWRGAGRDDNEHALTQVEGLAGDAAACAVSGSDADQAVQLLESGRAVLWSQLLADRADLDRLGRVSPQLADRLRHVAAALGEVRQPSPLHGPVLG